MPHIRCITPWEGEYFHGFYNIQPWDHAGKRVLCQRVPFIDRMPTGNEEATIGIINVDRDRFEPVTTTKAWNFQLGAMAQWLKLPGSDCIAVNALAGDRFVCESHDVRTGDCWTLDQPLFVLSQDGTRGLGFDLARPTAIRPGYAYAGVHRDLTGRDAPDDDGVYLLDFVARQTKLIISFAELLERFGTAGMRGKPLIMGRLLFNADDSRLILSFRYFDPQTNKWPTSLVTANLDGSAPHQVVGFDQNVAHVDWLGRDRVLAWCKPPGATRGGFYVFHDLNPQTPQPFAHDALTVDGHCTFTHDEQWLALDTFPDRESNQTLILLHVPTQTRYDLAVLPASRTLRGDLRCDMHPCWNRADDRILFDSMHEGRRTIHVVEDLPK